MVADRPRARCVIEVAAAGDYTCALRRDHRVVCWGDGDNGQIGRPAATADCIKYSFAQGPSQSTLVTWQPA